MAQPNKTRGLGRGLSALMADVIPNENLTETAGKADQLVPIEQVHANPDQPRRHFNQDALTELADSISVKGIIQPIIVRRSPRDSNGYEIVAGERRWRAAQMVQLHEIPVIIRDFDDTEVLEVAIIENIQRADLNAVDEAAGYKQLMSKFGHTQEQLASALGKSRSHIANLMRLLTLPDGVQDLIVEGQLSAGHARALVGNPNATTIASDIVTKGLSVRDVEKLVKTSDGEKKPSQRKVKAPSKDADTIQIENELSAALGLGVNINHESKGEAGQLVLKYKTLEQLDDLLRLLSGSN